MMAQYIEGLPGLVTEGGRQFVRSDTPQFDRQVLLFYEQYLALDEGPIKVDDSSFRMGEETGATFRCFVETIQSANRPVRALKGQIAGPFTLLSGLKDQDGRALIYDDRFLDIIPKLLGLKARWQIEFMRTFGVPVIVFLDEPALAGFGSSAFITVTAELVLRLLTEVVDTIHAAGGIAGIHVCANTDWLLAFKSNLDIINFDSHGYFDKFTLFRQECLQFMAGGGNIAWGVVPTKDRDTIRAETPESLADRWTGQVSEFAAGDVTIEEVIAHSLFTPSCGCGSLPEECAELVLNLLKGFCRIIRREK
jgi:methionine synthase II (cobalamin-independent)